MIRTINTPLHNQKGHIVHTATIRSDWNDNDYNYLKELFPKTYIKTERITYPIDFIGNKYHHTDFNSLYTKKLS